MRRTKAAVPALILKMFSHNERDREIKSWMCIVGFKEGWATAYHFNVLLDEAERYRVAARIVKDEHMTRVAEFFRTALWNVHVRYSETKRLGCTGDELSTLCLMMEVIYEFWYRHSTNMFLQAEQALRLYRKKLEEEVCTAQKQKPNSKS